MTENEKFKQKLVHNRRPIQEIVSEVNKIDLRLKNEKMRKKEFDDLQQRSNILIELVKLYETYKGVLEINPKKFKSMVKKYDPSGVCTKCCNPHNLRVTQDGTWTEDGTGKFVTVENVCDQVETSCEVHGTEHIVRIRCLEEDVYEIAEFGPYLEG